MKTLSSFENSLRREGPFPVLALPLDPKEHAERKAKAWKGKMAGPFRNLGGNLDNPARESAMTHLRRAARLAFVDWI